jgi:predicted lipid-binding transport protein (Tim44 family)
MDGSFPILDIIVIGLIAIFILLRLRNTLGSTDGRISTRREDQSDRETDRLLDESDTVVPLPRKDDDTSTFGQQDENAVIDIPAEVLASGPAREGLEILAKIDQNFNAANFVDGAQWAHGEISIAFAVGDHSVLRTLLRPDLYENFAAAISEREANGEILERELVRLHSSDILSADIIDNIAKITMKFVSDQIDTYRNAEGIPLDIDENGTLREVVDIWTFNRNVNSSDPAWMLVETRAGD